MFPVFCRRSPAAQVQCISVDVSYTDGERGGAYIEHGRFSLFVHNQNSCYIKGARSSLILINMFHTFVYHKLDIKFRPKTNCEKNNIKKTVPNNELLLQEVKS